MYTCLLHTTSDAFVDFVLDAEGIAPQIGSALAGLFLVDVGQAPPLCQSQVDNTVNYQLQAAATLV
jgi:hypothetical protein